MIDKNLWRQMGGHKGLLLASTVCGILCAVAILWQAFYVGWHFECCLFGEGCIGWPLATSRTIIVLGYLTFCAASSGRIFCLSARTGDTVRFAAGVFAKNRQDRAGGVAAGTKRPVALYDKRGHRYAGKLFQQVFAAALQTAVIPLLFLCFIFPRDLMSGFILLVTAPLVPFFMMLIGKWTNKVNARQWKIINRLSGYLHDVMAGLTTLKLMNRSAEQGEKKN